MAYPAGISEMVWNRVTLFMYEFSGDLYNKPGGSIDSLHWFIERSPGATQEDFNNFQRIIDNNILLLKQHKTLCAQTSVLSS